MVRIINESQDMAKYKYLMIIRTSWYKVDENTMRSVAQKSGIGDINFQEDDTAVVQANTKKALKDFIHGIGGSMSYYNGPNIVSWDDVTYHCKSLTAATNKEELKEIANHLSDTYDVRTTLIAPPYFDDYSVDIWSRNRQNVENAAGDPGILKSSEIRVSDNT